MASPQNTFQLMWSLGLISMIKKSITREQTYRDALAISGIEWATVKVACYSFPEENTVQIFHLELMIAGVKFLLFDGVETSAYILLDKDDNISPQKIAEIAGELGGKERVANLS